MTASAPPPGRAFLGIGWAFPVALAAGAVETAAYEDSVAQAVWIVLATAPGERAMRPTFGCGIHDLVFAPSNTATITAARSAVLRALQVWEPRITVLSVDVAAAAEDPARLDISIEYRIVSTNSTANLVYPFYLQEPGV